MNEWMMNEWLKEWMNQSINHLVSKLEFKGYNKSAWHLL
jgi:hypothetical protein